MRAFVLFIFRHVSQDAELVQLHAIEEVEGAKDKLTDGKVKVDYATGKVRRECPAPLLGRFVGGHTYSRPASQWVLVQDKSQVCV